MEIPFSIKLFFLASWPWLILCMLCIGIFKFLKNMVLGIAEVTVDCVDDLFRYRLMFNYSWYLKQMSIWYKGKRWHYVAYETQIKEPIELKDDKENNNEQQNIR